MIQVASGSYVGTGSSFSISGLGFAPKFVQVKEDSSSVETAYQRGIMRFGSMPGSKAMPDNSTIVSNYIGTLGSDGFDVGTGGAGINESGRTYYWTAIGGDDSDIVVGSYSGNGVNGRNITGIGFTPALVFVAAENNTYPRMKFGVGGDASFSMANIANVSNGITDLISDGFVVSDQNQVNESGVTNYYLAIREVAGNSKVGTYTGNGSDNRDITGIGFAPLFVMVKGDTTHYGAFRSDNMADGYSTPYNIVELALNVIQAFLSDGFQIGTSGSVNTSSVVYSYFAIGLPTTAYGISGVVTLSGEPVEGAIVRCVRQSDNVALAYLETASDGSYLFEELSDGELYHLAVEYEAEGVKYNAKSLWNVAPVELE